MLIVITTGHWPSNFETHSNITLYQPLITREKFELNCLYLHIVVTPSFTSVNDLHTIGIENSVLFIFSKTLPVYTIGNAVI